MENDVAVKMCSERREIRGKFYIWAGNKRVEIQREPSRAEGLYRSRSERRCEWKRNEGESRERA